LAKDFFLKLVSKDPEARYDANQALAHPWITRDTKSIIPYTFEERIHYFNKEQELAIVFKLL
jgi:serine/threonine protein kinase